MALREPHRPHRHVSPVNIPPPGAKPVWQGYLLTAQDQRLIDQMIGQALLDPTFCEQVLKQRTLRFLAEWGFTPETSLWLSSLEVSSLHEFAEAITLP